MRFMAWRALSIRAHHIIGFHFSQETRALNAFHDVATRCHHFLPRT